MLLLNRMAKSTLPLFQGSLLTRIGVFSFVNDNRRSLSKHASNTRDETVPGIATLFDASSPATKELIATGLSIIEDFITPTEEANLMTEIERALKRVRYEFSHWDNAIHGYRESEKRDWSPENLATIDRVRQLAFPSNVGQLELVHVLDLAAEGHIKPHVDSVKFCGSVIAGISLLADSVMRLERTTDEEAGEGTDERNTTPEWALVHLPKRSLYIMKNAVRYDFTHAILKDEESLILGRRIPKGRRVSIMCRNEPEFQKEDSNDNDTSSS